MKKINLYILSFLFFTLFVLSLNKPFMEWWADYRTYDLHAPFTRARYGDLYSGCFLPQYIDTGFKKLREYKSERANVDLYILHDSYLENKIKKENFIGVDELILSDFRNAGKKISLDEQKRNILIIECSERTANWRLTDTALLYSRLNIRKKISGDKFVNETGDLSILNYFFNPSINQNIEFNLFDYELLRPVKEAKAKLNFDLFERLPHDITVSSDKKYLLLKSTVDYNYAESSFRWIPDGEIDFMIKRLSSIKRHYKKVGFKEIYISIIPNPVSIVDTDRMPYNRKISRIENHPLMPLGYIDVFNTFKNSKQRVYRRDDTHWNTTGIQIWIDEVNSKITAP